MLGANKPVKTGQELIVGDHRINVVSRRGPFFELQFPGSAISLFEKFGEIPLPPYINRPAGKDDLERYQTVYSNVPGAVAAPTAGLHFDNELIHRIKGSGVAWGAITLHVGAGTFQPVREARIENHQMHNERLEVDESMCQQVADARSRGGRVIAVGTTVVRALESAARSGNLIPSDMDTSLFITPGYPFRVVDAMITNFHLPKSTLLMMVSAFAGLEEIMSTYRFAIENRYRFFSYGDAMFLERKQ
jgi:S-adenosylmethionine:tRNA ribosyltransferase-isomerase